MSRRIALSIATLLAFGACSAPSKTETDKKYGLISGGNFPGSGGGGGTVTGCTNGTSVDCTLVGANVVPTLHLPSITQPTPGQQLQQISTTGTPTWGQPVPDIADGFADADDFLAGSVSSKMWIMAASGSGATCATNGSSVGQTNRPGIAVCHTGSTAAGRVAYTSGASAVFPGGGTWTYTDTLGLLTASSAADVYDYEDGFINVATSDAQTNGCYFLYDPSNHTTLNSGLSTNWIAVCVKGGVKHAVVLDGVNACDVGTSVTSPFTTVNISTDTGWQKLAVILNATASEADFFINGTVVCKLNVDVPNAVANVTGYGFGYFKQGGTTGTTDILQYHDYATIQFAASSPRS